MQRRIENSRNNNGTNRSRLAPRAATVFHFRDEYEIAAPIGDTWLRGLDGDPGADDRVGLASIPRTGRARTC